MFTSLQYVLLLQVICSGVFELRLASFRNDRGLDYEGNCCNGVKDSTNPSVGPVCTGECHTFFTVCLTTYRRQIPMDLTKDKCVFGYVTTGVLGRNNLDFENHDGLTYPVNFHFNVSWKVSIIFVCIPYLLLPSFTDHSSVFSNHSLEHSLSYSPDFSIFRSI